MLPCMHALLHPLSTRADLLPNSCTDKMKRGGDAHRDPSTHTHTADAALNLNWQQRVEKGFGARNLNPNLSADSEKNLIRESAKSKNAL